MNINLAAADNTGNCFAIPIVPVFRYFLKNNNGQKIGGKKKVDGNKNKKSKKLTETMNENKQGIWK